MNLPCDSTVYTMFRTTAKWRADALAIECGQQQWTYGQLLDVVDRLASVLLSEGAEPGDRVAILSENRAEYTMLQLAWPAGARGRARRPGVSLSTRPPG